MPHVDQFLVHYGYFAIFGLLMLGIVGPLIPDEAILVASGVFVHRGQLHFVPAALAAIAGSMCGISLSYAIGLYGFGWLDRNSPPFRNFAQQHLEQAERWFLRYGRWTLFLGYYVAGVRHFTALFAGVSKMPFRAFAFSAYPGAICWACLFIAVGFFGGAEWARIGSTVDRWIVVAVAALCLLAVIWWRATRKRTRAS